MIARSSDGVVGKAKRSKNTFATPSLVSPPALQAFLSRLEAAASSPDDLAAWLVSALDEASKDDTAAASLLRALAAALLGEHGPAAKEALEAAAFDWGPPALRAGDAAGPAARDAAMSLASIMATSLSSPKEAVALLSGEAADGSEQAAWAVHQAAALAALPAALARAGAGAADPAARERLLASAYAAARAGLGRALRLALVEGGGGGAESAAAGWWASLPALAARGGAATAATAATAVAADLGTAVLGLPLPLSTSARLALTRPAAAAVERACASVAGRLVSGGGRGGSGGEDTTAAAAAALQARAATLTAAGVAALRGLGFDPASTAPGCPFLPTSTTVTTAGAADSDDEAEHAATAVDAGTGWAVAVAACLCVTGCTSEGEPAALLPRAAAAVTALLAAASAARAPGAVALAAAAAAVAAARTPPSPASPATTALLTHLGAAMAGVPSAVARNAAFHAWDAVLASLALADRVGAAVGCAAHAAAGASAGVEALALHHLAGMVSAAAGGGGAVADAAAWRAAAPALFTACTARLGPGPPPLTWPDDLALAHRAEPTAAAVAGLRLLLLLRRRGGPVGEAARGLASPSDLAALRARALLPLQAAAARGAASLRAIGADRLDAKEHEAALALERVREAVARVLELVEGK